MKKLCAWLLVSGMLLQTPGTTVFAAGPGQSGRFLDAGGQARREEAGISLLTEKQEKQAEVPKNGEMPGEQTEAPITGEGSGAPTAGETPGGQTGAPATGETPGDQTEAPATGETSGDQAEAPKKEETPGSQEESGKQSGAQEEQNGETAPGAEAGNGTLQGQLHLSLIYTLPYSDLETLNSGLQAVLTREGQQFDAAFSMQEGESVSKKAEASFVDLEPGEYHLHISGGSFAAYDQDVVIQAMDQKMQFLDVYTGMDLSDMEKHPGVVGYGDVDHDGVIDENDKTQLIQAIHQENTESA